MLNGRSILITGATGTLGKALVKHILDNYQPRRLVVFSRDEHKHYLMAQQFKNDCLRFFVGDVRDFDRVNQACKDIDYIIHAAAMKHVDIAEFNPMECIKTNVIGTENVIKAAIAHGIEKAILISTDKAINSVSLYGATKLAAEKLFIAANNMDKGTKFSVVRLGNVINSSGSVLPHYRKLIAEGAEFLPLTHPLMARFWISADECAEFILKCLMHMSGQETFVPKMKSIYIRDLIDALGKGFETVGMRPGEKLKEIICPRETADITADCGSYYLIKEGVPKNSVPIDFQYDSMDNQFLTVEEIRKQIGEAQI
jgi:UDP-N-acetylglucosamine 4,6-dehydratase